MSKTLKFTPELADLIMADKKTCTWRLWDDKELQTGDKVIFMRRPELVNFATAKLTSVIEKLLSEINEEDKDGHESYSSEEEMYSSFSKIYHRSVDQNTHVKIIKFKLLELV